MSTVDYKAAKQGQTNLIKFIESNKYDNVYSKFDACLFDQISLIKF